VRSIPLLLAAALLATCGGGTSEYDAAGTTREERAFQEAQATERKRWMEKFAAGSPHPGFRPTRILACTSADLASTAVLPHLDAPFPAGSNALWCATFSLAWTVLGRDVAGGSVRLGPPAPPAFAEGMERSPFPAASLNPASFLARAGRGRERIAASIREELDRRFQVRTIAIPEVPADGALAFAFLRKRLPFALRFEPAAHPLRFAGGTRAVPAFGVNRDSTHPRKRELLGQVIVRFEERPNPLGAPTTFVLEFVVEGGKDVLLLAAVPREPTLGATWAGVRDRCANPGRRLDDAVLVVPKIDFELTHRFVEILGAPILDGPLRGQPIVEALQAVRLRLDEGGADVESHAILASAGIHDAYLFDRPFLLALREATAAEPYLLLWVENDEILAREE
jgi:hypothetical protein